MPSRVRIRFANVGGRRIPIAEIHLKQLGKRPRVHSIALIDTGSSFTIVSRGLLEAEGFDLSQAKTLETGIFGVGGRTDAWYLENFIVAVQDEDQRLQWVNLPRLFFTEAELPPLLGRELLTLFNATVHIDFADRTGYIEIG